MSLNTGHPEVQTPYVPERIQDSNDLHLPGARDDAEHLLREWLVDVFGLTGYGEGGEHYSPNGSDLMEARVRRVSDWGVSGSVDYWDKIEAGHHDGFKDEHVDRFVECTWQFFWDDPELILTVVVYGYVRKTENTSEDPSDDNSYMYLEVTGARRL